MTRMLENPRQYDAPPDDDWEEQVRDEYAAELARDDAELHRRYDEGVGYGAR